MDASRFSGLDAFRFAGLTSECSESSRRKQDRRVEDEDVEDLFEGGGVESDGEPKSDCSDKMKVIPLIHAGSDSPREAPREAPREDQSNSDSQSVGSLKYWLPDVSSSSSDGGQLFQSLTGANGSGCGGASSSDMMPPGATHMQHHPAGYPGRPMPQGHMMAGGMRMAGQPGSSSSASPLPGYADFAGYTTRPPLLSSAAPRPGEHFSREAQLYTMAEIARGIRDRMTISPMAQPYPPSAGSGGCHGGAASELANYAAAWANGQQERMGGGGGGAMASGGQMMMMPSPEELPSLGSAEHFKGTCWPCLFWMKHACAKGKHCDYCHILHEGMRAKRIRPSKKTRMQRREQQDDDYDDPSQAGSGAGPPFRNSHPGGGGGGRGPPGSSSSKLSL
eukprot:TRINITY_DN104210_c0_g1_i1.p1 TRINITY_DN104210_c0_g1~~TRINITY_DN104210_c0_g1_i1.p1  ORF type:complete len:392 (-),score=56.98 TRINITY_DN104210_c0_g1_i1:178-1353(-)